MGGVGSRCGAICDAGSAFVAKQPGETGLDSTGLRRRRILFINPTVRIGRIVDAASAAFPVKLGVAIRSVGGRRQRQSGDERISGNVARRRFRRGSGAGTGGKSTDGIAAMMHVDAEIGEGIARAASNGRRHRMRFVYATAASTAAATAATAAPGQDGRGTIAAISLTGAGARDDGSPTGCAFLW